MTSFCPNCFAPSFEGCCASCGYRWLAHTGAQLMLSPGETLNGQYLLGRVLGAGGFGVTYLAKDTRTGERVAVKEYMPATLALRSGNGKTVTASGEDARETFAHGLTVFRREADTLRRFAGNAGIVQVKDCFSENGTAYFAMEFLDGVNLAGLARASGGRLQAAHVVEVLEVLSHTLLAVHAQGMLHRDVSPENIFITRDGSIKLIDFGATRFFVGERSRSLSVILKPGFAPPEQYSAKGNQGPWTDLYALCATCCTLVTGNRPPDAPDRLAGAPLQSLSQCGLPQQVAAALESGLQLDYRKRPQTMDAFLAALALSSPSVSGNYVPSPPPSLPQQNVSVQPPAQPHTPAPQPQSAPLNAIRGTPYLQSLCGGVRGDKWLIPKNMVMVIGRACEQCNIVLENPNISRVHCEIRYEEKTGVFYLTDCSTNGTLLNGSRLVRGDAYRLSPGDVFYLLNPENGMEVGLC